MCVCTCVFTCERASVMTHRAISTSVRSQCAAVWHLLSPCIRTHVFMSTVCYSFTYTHILWGQHLSIHSHPIITQRPAPTLLALHSCMLACATSHIRLRIILFLSLSLTYTYTHTHTHTQTHTHTTHNTETQSEDTTSSVTHTQISQTSSTDSCTRLCSPTFCFHWDINRCGNSNRDNGHKLAS